MTPAFAVVAAALALSPSAVPSAGAPFEPDPRPTGDIVITRPLAGRPALGMTEVVAELEPRGVAHVEALVDGRSLGRRETPPFRWLIDLGDANVAHRFVVRALLDDGTLLERVLLTPSLRVDDRVDLALRQIYVGAAREGASIDDLARDDFSIRDGGRAERLVTFERGDVPLTAVLLIDASHSMRGARLETAVAGARAFIEGMLDLDRAMLLLFADDVVQATRFTGFPEVLAAGAGSVESYGSTAINDHLFLALQLLEARQGRRVVVLLSDGVDNTSVLDMRQVADVARRSQAMLYWLRLPFLREGLDVSSIWRDAAGHRRQIDALRRAVRDSGGRVLDLADTEAARRAFAGVLGELRAQYVLGYYPSRATRAGEWRPVEVRVGRPGVKLRYRPGYVGRTSP